MKYNKNLLLFGPNGSGKTLVENEARILIEGAKNGILESSRTQRCCRTERPVNSRTSAEMPLLHRDRIRRLPERRIRRREHLVQCQRMGRARDAGPFQDPAGLLGMARRTDPDL